VSWTRSFCVRSGRRLSGLAAEARDVGAVVRGGLDHQPAGGGVAGFGDSALRPRGGSVRIYGGTRPMDHKALLVQPDAVGVGPCLTAESRPWRGQPSRSAAWPGSDRPSRLYGHARDRRRPGCDRRISPVSRWIAQPFTLRAWLVHCVPCVPRLVLGAEVPVQHNELEAGH
jgi:hypothetical protein